MFKFIKLFIILLLPPLVSLPFAIFFYKKNKLNFILFSALLALIINYLPPLWDTCHHYITFYSYKNETDSLILFKWLTNFDVAAVLLYRMIGVDFGFFNFIINFFIIFIFFVIFKKIDLITNLTNRNTIILIFVICGLGMVPLLAFNRFTLALAIMYLAVINKFNKKSDFILAPLLVVLSFVIHSATYMYLIPAIGYIIASKYNNKILLFLYITTLFIAFRYVLFNSAIFNFTQSYQTLSETTSKISDYSKDSSFGYIGWDYISYSGSYIIRNVLKSCLIVLGIISLYANWNDKRYIVIESFFAVTVTLLFASWGFLVLTERTLIATTISTLFLLFYYLNNASNKMKTIIKLNVVLLILITFYCEFNFNSFLYPLFNDRNTSLSINTKLIYMPTVLLLDFEDFGYTSAFISKNYKPSGNQ